MPFSKIKLILASLALAIPNQTNAKPTNGEKSLKCLENQYIENGECVDVDDVCGKYEDNGAELCTEFYTILNDQDEDTSAYKLRGQCQNLSGGQYQCVCPPGMFKADRVIFDGMKESEIPCVEPPKAITETLACENKPNFVINCDFSNSMKPCSCDFVSQCLSNSPCTGPNEICEHIEGEDNATCRCKISHQFFDNNGQCSDISPCDSNDCQSNESCQVNKDKKTYQCVSRCNEPCDGEGQECRQDSVSNSIEDGNFMCTCKKGLTALDGKCVPIEENLDDEENDVVIPNVVDAQTTEKAKVDNNNSQDTQDAKSESRVDEAGASEGPQQTLFIVGVVAGVFGTKTFIE